MNRELANGMIVGLVIGMLVSILFAPEDCLNVKRKYLDRLLQALSLRNVEVIESIVDEDVH